MYHDFCQFNYKMSDLKNACEGTVSLGTVLDTDCKCSIALYDSLELSKLKEECEDISCIANGAIIHQGVGNMLMPCTCEICQYSVDSTDCETVYKCLTVDNCKKYQYNPWLGFKKTKKAHQSNLLRAQ